MATTRSVVSAVECRYQMDKRKMMAKRPRVENLRGGPISNGPMQTRPLVALLDGRDCSIEMPILKVT